MNISEHRRRLLKLALTSGLLLLLAIYVAAYVSLRNRGIREARRYDADGFLYDRAEHVFQTQDMSTHEFRSKLFAPLNYLDQVWFDGPGPIRCILFDLS